MLFRSGYDDSLDAFGVHGVGGTMGALFTGLLASGAINAVFGKNAAGVPLPTGAIDGNWHQVLNQAVGVGIGRATIRQIGRQGDVRSEVHEYAPQFGYPAAWPEMCILLESGRRKSLGWQRPVRSLSRRPA